MKADNYKTLLQEGSFECIIQKSRFIGYASPCDDEKTALDFISRIRMMHKNASHNCYAYIIGKNAGIMRYSDDGEPSGTAGLPIIEVMKKRMIVNSAVVVTRYFGGILLGAGGLVRAYSHCCKNALSMSEVVVMEKSSKWLIEVSYSCWQQLKRYLEKSSYSLTGTQFGVTVVINVVVKKTDEEQFTSDILRMSEGQAELLLEEEVYYPWPEAEV